MAKQYGLILPDKQGSKKTSLAFSASRNVFGDESESDDDGNAMNAPSRQGDKIKRQIRVVQEKALEDDPTVYQYDELYDDIEKKKQEKQSIKKEDKKPKYIEKLLTAAEKRKKENERRVERQIQKEREEEGDKFADKESFVTTSYKNKLEEMRLDEQKQRREDYLEEICDVTKQNDLGGFYRHLYDQQLNSDKNDTAEKPSDKEDNTKADVDQPPTVTQPKSKNVPKRVYRKRKHSGDENDGDAKSDSDDEITKQKIQDIKTNRKEKIHLPSNIDADSDFSIDDSSSDESDNGKSSSKENKIVEDIPKTDTNNVIETKVSTAPFDDFKQPNPVVKVENQETNEQITEIRIKIDIWKKRTVGEVFDQALQRYYERKAARC
ncbi:uncharacterized protein LOC143917886 [Arctopsyche grandis]|uniref:uncharacterized protein LOC143917886 n=1 Tax=Arctopsyche grandis TaxID=121162 RepID=UPI00406DA1DB